MKEPWKGMEEYIKKFPDGTEEYEAYIDYMWKLQEARKKRANIYILLAIVSIIISGIGMILAILGAHGYVNQTLAIVAFFIGLASVIGYIILYGLSFWVYHKIDTEGRPNLFERWLVK